MNGVPLEHVFSSATVYTIPGVVIKIRMIKSLFPDFVYCMSLHIIGNAWYDPMEDSRHYSNDCFEKRNVALPTCIFTHETEYD